MLKCSVETSVRQLDQFEGTENKTRLTALNRDVKTHIARKRREKEA